MSESNEPDIMYHGAEWFEENKGKLLYGALAVIIAAGGNPVLYEEHGTNQG